LRFRFSLAFRPEGAWVFALLLALNLALPCSRALSAAASDTVLEKLEEAFEAHTNDRFDEAVTLYTRILDTGGLDRADQAVVYLLRGQAQSDKGDCIKAIEDFTLAIDLRSDYAHAFYFRSLCYQRMKDYDQAWRDVDRAILLKPDKLLYLKNRALLASLTGRTVPPLPAEQAAKEKAAAKAAAAKKEEPQPTGIAGFIQSRISMIKSLLGMGKKKE